MCIYVTVNVTGGSGPVWRSCVCSPGLLQHSPLQTQPSRVQAQGKLLSSRIYAFWELFKVGFTWFLTITSAGPYPCQAAPGAPALPRRHPRQQETDRHGGYWRAWGASHVDRRCRGDSHLHVVRVRDVTWCVTSSGALRPQSCCTWLLVVDQWHAGRPAEYSGVWKCLPLK